MLVTVDTLFLMNFLQAAAFSCQLKELSSSSVHSNCLPFSRSSLFGTHMGSVAGHLGAGQLRSTADGSQLLGKRLRPML